jgi:hypothetical protein
MSSKCFVLPFPTPTAPAKQPLAMSSFSQEDEAAKAADPRPSPRPRPRTGSATQPRCCVKGCVFPAAPYSAGKCLQHDRQQREPALFQSLQPTLLLLDQARFVLPDVRPPECRWPVRHRSTHQRDRLFREVA